MPVARVSASRKEGAAAGPRAATYRPDIDGLRALAILPILLLHCGFARLRGGFVGVDIFFVISGFLITSILARDLAEGRFSLGKFYRHRVVRIFPALAIMIAASLIVGSRLLLPNQLRDLGRSAVFTTGFASNFYFYVTTDYFAAASDSKPLVHTWSLAVEEQFYLLYPVLLWSLWRLGRPRVVQAIIVLAVLSFVFGGWLAVTRPSAGFFLLPARVWELSLGALIALGAVPEVASARLRAVLCLGSLGIVVASFVGISGGWPFPVPFAAPPAFAAALLIAYGARSPTFGLLASRPLRAVGLISYSAYLWHRPIISFYEASGGSTSSWLEAGGLVVATLVLAWVSYVAVEQPARRRWRDRGGAGPMIAAAGAMIALAGCGVFMFRSADCIRPLAPRLAQVASYLGWDTTEAGRRQFSTDRCFVLPTRPGLSPDCLRFSNSRPNVLLLGDSHAAHFSAALHELLPNSQISQATAAGCRPLIEGGGIRSCRAVMERAFRTLDGRHPDLVILSALWLPFETADLLETVHWLTQRGIRALVIGPSVEYDTDLPALIVRAASRPDPALVGRHRLARPFDLDRALASPVRRAGALYASPIKAECSDTGCRLLAPDGSPIHFDKSHFTPGGARAVLSAVLARAGLLRRTP